MKEYTLVITMCDKVGDYFVQLEYLKLIDAYKVLISNGFRLPNPKEINVDYTDTITENPGHQQGVRYLMRAVDKGLRTIPRSKWTIHIHNDVYILDFNKINEIVNIMIDKNKKIAAFPWYGPETLSTDFFIVNTRWALDNEVFMFPLDSGCGVEGDLYMQANKDGSENNSNILFLNYDVTKDKQEVRERLTGGARNMPWREEYRILHDHLGEYFYEMRKYGPWNASIEKELRVHRGYNNE